MDPSNDFRKSQAKRKSVKSAGSAKVDLHRPRIMTPRTGAVVLAAVLGLVCVSASSSMHFLDEEFGDDELVVYDEPGE